jgi:salicylate hydroxylase
VSKGPSIAIAGGGLAGLAAAAALAQFGFDAEVFEAAPRLGEIGAGVNVSPQGIRALRAIGLGDAIDAAANVAPGVFTRDMHSGAPLDYRDHSIVEPRFGAPVSTFHRADLLDALAGGVDPRRIHLDRRLTALEERPASVELHFANGITHAADLLIGADGIHSQVRRALYGDDKPTYTGQMVWRALVPSTDLPTDALAPSGHIQWLGSGRHFFAYYLRGRDVVNIVTQQDTKRWVEEGWSIPGDVDEMHASFPDAEPRLAALLDAVTRCSQWGLFLRPPTGNWGRGRIQLIGDAAHAMMPQAGQGPRNPSRTPTFWRAGLRRCRTILRRRWTTSAPSASLVRTRCSAAPRIFFAPSTITTRMGPTPRARKSTQSTRWAWIWGYDVVAAWDQMPAMRAVT